MGSDFAVLVCDDDEEEGRLGGRRGFYRLTSEREVPKRMRV